MAAHVAIGELGRGDASLYPLCNAGARKRSLAVRGAAFALILAGCAAHTDRAPAAPTSGGFSNPVGSGAGPGDGSTGVVDAGSGAPSDGSTGDAAAVCTPGQMSVPYSATDPCAQGGTSCAQLGWVAVAACQVNGTWDPLTCTCLPPSL
jgi:hypothetical protein